MKLIYFVRHAESEANVDSTVQGRNSLTEKGIEQAEVLAERFKHITLDKIIGTSRVRSKQTARAVSAVINLPVEENDLFIEREGEFEVIWEYKHLSVTQITEMVRKKLDKPNWNYEKQELFESLKKRIKKAIEYLEYLPEENILVVTHGAFLKVLVAYLIFKESLTEEQAVLFMKGTGTTNTGITVCKCNTETKEWRLITWNDQTHLA